jgi:hypothetical protein
MTSSDPGRYSQSVEEEHHMALAMERVLVPAVGRPTPPLGEETHKKLHIAVVFTSVESTLAALKEAGALASSLGARITLVVAQEVPYPLPLESPPVLVEFSENRFRVLASQTPVETNVQIFLCRERLDALVTALKPGSIVVVGWRKRWWPTKDEILARQLRRAGFEVIFKETE